MKSKFFPKKKTVSQYELTQEVIKNPLMGFVPRAEFPSTVSDNTLVYVDITLRELEPEEGRFEFETIEKENHFDRWRDTGKHAVLRLISDYPGLEEHMDIPDWLFEKTRGDGVFYDNVYGKGYSPDYNNSVFIEYHKQAVKALGKRYGDDTFISYVQLGSLGHWGEWHVHQNSGLPSIPVEKIRHLYVKPYLDAFPKAKIMMRRPFKIARENNFGLYNDMVGHFPSTGQWMEWISQGGPYEQTMEEDALVPMTDAWETAPVGGELTSAIPMSQLLTTNLTSTIKMLTESHTSLLGPKIPQEYEGDSIRYQKEIHKVLQSIGYRIGITKTVWSESFTSIVKVKLTWENNGVSPIYWEWPVYLYFIDYDKEILEKIHVDLVLTELLPGKKINTVTEFQLNDRRKSAEGIYVGIEDPMTNIPAVMLVSNQERLGNLSLVKH